MSHKDGAKYNNRCSQRDAKLIDTSLNLVSIRGQASHQAKVVKRSLLSFGKEKEYDDRGRLSIPLAKPTAAP